MNKKEINKIMESRISNGILKRIKTRLHSEKLKRFEILKVILKSKKECHEISKSESGSRSIIERMTWRFL